MGRAYTNFETGVFSSEASTGISFLNCALTRMKTKRPVRPTLPWSKPLCSLIAALVMLVRETKLWNGMPSARVTHVAFAIPNLGPAELVVTETLLPSKSGGSAVERSLSAFVR